jgi:hypothetical protein
MDGRLIVDVQQRVFGDVVAEIVLCDEVIRHHSRLSHVPCSPGDFMRARAGFFFTPCRRTIVE